MSAASAPLEKGFDPDEPRDDHGRWEIEIAKGQAAMNKVIATHRDAHNAMKVPEVLVKGARTDGQTRMIFQHEEHRAVLRRDGLGLDAPWVLTAYQGNEHR